MSVFVKTKKERPRRCFLCIGKALPLGSDDGVIPGLIHKFYTSGDLTKHFRRMHLSNLRESAKIIREACDMVLDDKPHLQNHALRVQGTVFWNRIVLETYEYGCHGWAKYCLVSHFTFFHSFSVISIPLLAVEPRYVHGLSPNRSYPAHLQIPVIQLRSITQPDELPHS